MVPRRDFAEIWGFARLRPTHRPIPVYGSSVHETGRWHSVLFCSAAPGRPIQDKTPEHHSGGGPKRGTSLSRPRWMITSYSSLILMV